MLRLWYAIDISLDMMEMRRVPSRAAIAVTARRSIPMPESTTKAARAKRTKPPEKRYELVERVLRANMAGGRLPKGLVLLEAPIAEILQTSRAPVQKALRILEEKALVKRFEGRGYLVGGGEPRPLRTDIRELGLAVPDEVDLALQSRGSWERIALAVEAAVMSCLVFGEFRIVEAEAAQHFRVSRTIIRDVLGRLQARGLLRKNQSSHWVAGPLTAELIKERYQLRAILEPAALLASAPHNDRQAMLRLRERMARSETAGNGGGESFEDIEEAFLEHCILGTPNRQLAEVIRQNLMPLTGASRLLGRLGLPSDLAAIPEARMALDLLLNDSVTAAAEFWRDHLERAAKRNIARLKIVAVIRRPKSFAPYLTAV
jgi:DNA-binding GntR family transcriptional regulator